MAQLTIRQLDDTAAARLRERAAAAGRTLEQEAREILTTACADPSAVLARLRSRLASYPEKPFADVTEVVRQMRDERSETA
jgi:plasmid stability protein